MTKKKGQKMTNPLPASHIRLGATLLMALAIFAGSAEAQEKLDIDSSDLCSYYEEEFSDDIYAFKSDEEAAAFVDRIMEHAALPQNFTIQAANVPNAAAIYRDKKRYILYNQEFMKTITDETGSEWAAISIMAHEIAHHLAGHTLSIDEKRPDLELQADQWSGHVLFRMGASIEEAKVAMEQQPDGKGSKTHPPRSARLTAIHNGWVLAEEQTKKKKKDDTEFPATTPPPVIHEDAPPPPPPVRRPRPTTPHGSVLISNVLHNATASHPAGLPGGLGMDIHIGGILENARGKIAQVSVSFYFQNGVPLRPDAREVHFAGTAGIIATGTPRFPVTSDRFDLAGSRIQPIPYYVLNLAPTNFQQTYLLRMVAALFVDGIQIAASPPLDFTVRW